MLYKNLTLKSVGKTEHAEKFIHPEKSVPVYEILLVTEGTVHLCEDYNRYSVTEGDIIVLDKNKSYYGYMESLTPVSLYRLYFDGEPDTDIEVKLVHCKESTGRIIKLFNELIALDRSYDQPSEAFVHTMGLLFVELYRLFLEKQNPQFSPPLHDICKWIYDNSSANIKATDVAKKFCYNEDYLTRLFKNYYNMGIKNYIDSCKIKYIKNLLQNPRYILRDIPAMCGFSNYRSFLMFFSYHEGITPTQYRKMCFIL